ncbi:hypothetical protein D1BOALGB6SA_8264 [Olavius sp. associated proteobacterium Delta 1]|nr:hypothetical protein D1BOALGB6SA_8264 [Olavius sp. associated proteobacterium Delta 1]
MQCNHFYCLLLFRDYGTAVNENLEYPTIMPRAKKNIVAQIKHNCCNIYCINT